MHTSSLFSSLSSLVHLCVYLSSIVCLFRLSPRLLYRLVRKRFCLIVSNAPSFFFHLPPFASVIVSASNELHVSRLYSSSLENIRDHPRPRSILLRDWVKYLTAPRMTRMGNARRIRLFALIFSFDCVSGHTHQFV